MNKYSVLLQGRENENGLNYYVNIALCAGSVEEAESVSVAKAKHQGMDILAVEEIAVTESNIREYTFEEVSGRIYFKEEA